MLRLLKVKELEDRRQVLLARSDVYRRTMLLEVSNIKHSAALLRHRFRLVLSPLRLLGFAIPVTRFFLGRKRSEPKEGGGFFSKLVSGVQVAGLMRSIFGRKKRDSEE